MSAFLGPIHTWLFNKVLFQNQMVETIETLAKENGWLDESVNLNRYGQLEQGDLADIVDPNNIHGWLQERVSLVESKLAYLVTVLSDGHQERLDSIYEVIYELGKKNSIHGKNAKEVFDTLETLLLNGMPCDRVNVLCEENEDKVVWRQTKEIHEKYWTMVGGSVEQFYFIRQYLIHGLLENSEFTYSTLENSHFEIKR